MVVRERSIQWLRQVGSLVQVCILLFCGRAFADDPLVQARQAFAAGETAYNLGRFEEALKSYEDAYRLSHLAPILFNLGQTHRRLYEEKGRIENLRQAREFYRAYLREVPISPQGKTVQDLLKEADAAYAKELHRQRERLLASCSGPQALQLAQDFVDQGDRVDAAYALDRYFQTPRNSRESLVTGYVLKARLALAANKEEEAIDAFARALALDPTATPPPSLGQDLVRVAAAARRTIAGKPPLAVRHVVPGEVDAGKIPTLRVYVDSDPMSMIRQYVLHFRPAGSQAYSEAETLVLPSQIAASLQPGAKVEYYIEAQGDQSAILQPLGSAERPFAFSVRSPQKPWYKQWWVWGIAGAVAVGTTAAVVATREGPFQAGPQVVLEHP